MALVFAIVLLSLSSVYCRPSDSIQQDIEEWNNFNQLNDLSSPNQNTWDKANDNIGNDIAGLFQNGNDFVRQQKLESPKLTQEREDAIFNETVMADPCYGVRCRKGKMCVVVDETTNDTACVCPTKCPLDFDPVCSSMGIQYNNTCLAHKENCAVENEMEIAYNQPCIAKQGPCLETDLSQFPIRFLEWMMHIRQANLLGKTDPNSSVRRLTDAERFSVSKWMFRRVDLEHDGNLQSYDMKYLLHQLLPVEHCIDEFLVECDADKSGDLSMFEWNNCLMPGTNSVENDFFDI